MVAFVNLVVGLATFYGSFTVGQHLVDVFRRVKYYFSSKEMQEEEDFASAPVVSPSVVLPGNIALCVAFPLLWVMYDLLFIYLPKSRGWTGPLIFAPFGAGIRWYSSHWNADWPRLKLATLCVNVIGSTLFAVLSVCKWHYTSRTTLLESFLVSLLSGFCGTLTTVSTFIYELHTMKHARYAYFYAALSVLAVQVLAFVILSIAHFGFHIPLS